MNRLIYKGFIEDIRNEKCTPIEVDLLIDIFEKMVESMANTKARKSWYKLEDLVITKRLGIYSFDLTLEREKIKRIIKSEKIKNLEQYTGYFECGHKNLKVVATRGDFNFEIMKSDG